MLVKKKILPVGNHLSKGGVVPATPEWCQEKVSQFERFKAKGIKVPVSWAHNPDALPLDPKAIRVEEEFHESKYKAGDVVSLTFEDRPEDPGPGLWIDADLPSVTRMENGNLIHSIELKDGTKTEGAISEVSAGFWNWKDGENELHQDCLIHVALTPLPVVHGQKGFMPAEQGGMKFLSTRTLFGGIVPISSNSPTQQKTLATEPKMADDVETKPETDTEPEKKEGEGNGKSVMEQLKTIGDAFKIGLPDPLPTDATEALNLIYTAACVVKGPVEEEQIVPEQLPNGPMMLSTALAQPGALGLMAKNLDKSYREGLVSRISALKDGRGLNEADHTKLLGQVPKLQLSLNSEAQVERSTLEDTLDVLERNMPSKKELATSTELEVVEQPTPPTKTVAELDRETDEKVAKATGRKYLG